MLEKAISNHFMNEPRLPLSFFHQSSDQVARNILGKRLVHTGADGPVAGLITETEAYLPQDDPANHAARGKTKRNAAMFASGGHWYVYLIYGVHYCLNIVTGPQDSGEAVLIRSLHPTHGVEVIHKNRNTHKRKNLTDGPGKITQALNVDLARNHTHTSEGNLYITDPGNAVFKHDITAGPRVGISKARDLPLRFVWKPPHTF